MPHTLLVTGARAPVALHLTRLLSAAGHRVLLADSLHRPLAGYSRLHDGCHLIPSPRFAPEACAAALKQLIAQEGIGLVIPTCEEIFHLASFWQAGDMPCPLLAPPFPALMRAHHKGWFIEDCAAAGLAVPDTTLLTDRAGLERQMPHARDLVFKPAWSRFADQVLIRPKAAVVAGLRPSPKTPWIAQRFVAGEEICVYALASEGRLTALSPYRALLRAGQGAAIAFEPLQDPGIEDFVTRYIEATGWSGQISFDLMRLPDGSVLPLECNPRATSGLHFFSDGPEFTRALSGAGPILRPRSWPPMGSRLAVWLSNLGKFRSTAHLNVTITDIHHWPGDSLSKLTQLRGLLPIARQALRLRKSLIAASTHDIEWNGPEDQAAL
ncbi:hypothetical protein EG244_12805 [Falsigemmobacter faecalis]|uniref:ATP-grasp domain-containing protein n=1 Tax=Falsigemmobacter faecalis TaxID=2488730 RepID=A0A3P3DLT2_9RHOB|nr:hypothetical protein EG244_12805 [Falsigemmobacter faecalis]